MHLTSSKEVILDKMKDLKNLDLDDDLFLLEDRGNIPLYIQCTHIIVNLSCLKKGELYDIYEFYEIGAGVPRQLIWYASWNQIEGLSNIPVNKWFRRSNLQVCST